MVSVGFRGTKNRITASAAFAFSCLLCTSSIVCAADDDGEAGFRRTGPPLPVDGEPFIYEDPKLRVIADRIVNGRANLEMLGDSIMHTGLSAAYLTTFRPKHGFRGYSSSGYMFSIHFWSGYTNAYSGWTDEGLALDEDVASLYTSFFTITDEGSPWTSMAGPANIRRMAALADIPGGARVAEMGSANFYNQLWADRDFLTETDARLRYRVLWYDHPLSMPFSVRGESTVNEEQGGSTSLFEVPVEASPELVMRYYELPEMVTLPAGARDFARRTGVAIHTAADHVEAPGEAMILGAARVWNDSKENGIQWGWLTAGGARAAAFAQIPDVSWRTYIEYQQSDTFLIQLGVNDLINQEATGVEAAGHIVQLVENILAAHKEARLRDPSIQEPYFLLVSPTDSWNPSDEGGYSDNREWVDLAEGLRAFAETREDTVYIDLRGMMEETAGPWFAWRSKHTRDGIHPKAPYWHGEGELWWDCHPQEDGAMFYADLVWRKIRDAAPGIHVADPSDLCACDINHDCVIDGADLSDLLSAWGDASDGSDADFDGDGQVDGLDIALLLGVWGPCP